MLDEETVSASMGQIGIGVGQLRWILVCLFDVVNGSPRVVFSKSK